MTYLNLGILAHVDAGKTSLTERLLHHTGVIDRVGSVDSGDTQTDTLSLERRRGITIRSAVVSFPLAGRTVNLIDTPGHADFIAEVERAVAVLDGAVLVVSAVEGVQPHTRLLSRTLDRLGIPTVLFVNKVDRAGARDTALVDDLATLSPRLLVMNRVDGLGGRHATVVPRRDDDLVAAAVELLDEDSALLDRYLADGRITVPELTAPLARLTAAARLRPVYFGSAATGAGISHLADGVSALLPSAAGDPAGPAEGVVFKVEPGPDGRNVAMLRVLRGTLRPRRQVTVHHRLADGGTTTARARIVSVRGFRHGAVPVPGAVPAGGIAQVSGLTGIRIGDGVGVAPAGPAALFARPTLDTEVTAVDAGDTGRLATALRTLAERDPLVQPEVTEDNRLRVKLYGEIQKQVLAAMLAEEFGVAVTFSASRLVHVERLAAPVEVVEEMGRWATTHHLATIGLRFAPAEPDSGVRYGIEVERGSLPAAFHTAVEESLRTSLRRGPHGWEVTDCRVTLTRSGFDNALSGGGDFRALTAVLVERALTTVGTVVCEPVSRFGLDVPPHTAGRVLIALGEAGAALTSQGLHGEAYRIGGTLRAAEVRGLTERLPGLASGEAVFTTEPAGFRTIV
ncbi:ribosomal protection tetracycline resistance protein [Stackebrandtia albiflava]|uniref:Ribosomal protection tetracycline resistance protein n=1 Tax=Stackebrandtia albiflava TaxID=406432 RepID=A0A562V2N4_9ACTN|nr:TetM/TetW/TetO/TetS family tetracycline resistance ribosomal protection protein [Stackebrandtia albiflava]TWJ12082.1 ribosomal protection tetracycline resistance protein [Stackebrandtia albiflava]